MDMAHDPGGAAVKAQIDPLWFAMMQFRQRKFEECAESCTQLLVRDGRDQAAMFLKCRALTMTDFVDDTELEEEGVAELLLDDNATASLPRPGTSFNRPATGQRGQGFDQSIRPVSSSGRPLTGFARPGTIGRPITGQDAVRTAMTGNRTAQGGSRPVTSLGRELRLGTASVQAQPGGQFLNVDRLDFTKLVKKNPAMAKVMCDYLIYHERNVRKALELCAEGTKEGAEGSFKDWWWKARLGKCYYKLGLFQDAENQYKSSVRDQDMVVTHLELNKVYVRKNQPKTALTALNKAAENHAGEALLLVRIARIHDEMLETDKSVAAFKTVLNLDASNVEALACLAANHFYSDQPEMSLRYYRRLLQMGVNNVEIWNNLGLCCFYASQYDMALSCFERALQLADDVSDVWYNIGQVAIGIGDLGLAYQAFKIAVSLDANHAESYCNLGVLELRKRNVEAAQANFLLAQAMAPHLFQPFFNGALLSYKLGNFQDAFSMAQSSIEINPEHSDTKELIKALKRHFQVL